MVVGTGLHVLYLAFAMAMVALVAGFTSTSFGTTLSSLALLLVSGADVGDFGWTAVATLALTVVALTGAVRRGAAREL